MLGDSLGEFISCAGYHPVCDDGFVSGNGDITGPRTHINKSQIQHAEALRYGDLHSCYGLQCKIGYMKSRHSYSLIQTVHDLIRQEGRYDIGSYRRSLMCQKVCHGIFIKIVFLDRIAYTVELDIQYTLFNKSLICSPGSEKLKRINILICDVPCIAELLLHMNRNGTQDSSRCRYAYLMQRASELYLKPARNLCNRLCYSRYIMYLSVLHGSGLMGLALYCDHMKCLIVHITHGTYYRPRTYVQTVDQLARILLIIRCFPVFRSFLAFSSFFLSHFLSSLIIPVFRQASLPILPQDPNYSAPILPICQGRILHGCRLHPGSDVSSPAYPSYSKDRHSRR